ncbi:hypothetical protein JCM1841_001226 [Sporobolomyces salmonicolor]
MRLPLALTSLCLLPSFAHAWGAAGHEIIAVISEIHLHPSVLAYLRSPSSGLLPDYAKGHLAPIATWPDRIRMIPEYRGWSGELHYGSWVGDHPPEVCAWPKDDGSEETTVQGEGDGGWKNEHDVLHAIANYTTRLERNPQECVQASLPPVPSWASLRFLVHFIGDAHQPMHLTNRERGGNGDPVRWDGRRTNLHSLWDGLLIARNLREQRNYTEPLPSKQIESALIGAIYDPYVRLLLWEGVRAWWRSSLPTWLACPSSLSSPPQLVFSTTQQKDTKQIVCPVHWASGTHKVTCELAFPQGYDEHENPPVEVGGQTAYYRAIRDSLTIQRLLTQAGLRLAATLNTIFREPAAAYALETGMAYDAVAEEGPLNLRWMAEAEEGFSY